MKSAAERITRGKGNFINCTDYDDAVKAINDAVAETRSEMMEFAEWCMDAEIYHSTNQKHWIYNADETSQLIFKTPDELFSYWLTNIKGK